MKTYILNILALSAIVFTSCHSLDVTNPNKLTDEEVTEILEGDDDAAKDLIISGVGNTLNTNFNIAGQSWSGYSDMNMNSQVDQDFLMCMRGNDALIGTEATATSTHATAYKIDAEATYRLSRVTWPYFAMGGAQLTAANKVLRFMTADAAKTSKKIARFRGQALTLRGYAYIQLMERFQPAYMQGGKDGKGMPIYKTSGLNTPAPISSAAATYDFILTDLKEAVELLTEAGADDADKGYTAVTDDIDLGVAQFLLARAALQAGEWTTAKTAAQDIVDHFPTLIAEANYGAKAGDLNAYCTGTKELKAENNAFQTLENNPEVIMGFVNGSNANTYMNSFANVFAPGYAGYSQEAPCIDNRLYEKLDNNDFRKDCFTTDEGSYTYITDDAATKIYTRTIPKYANLKWAATIAKGRSARTNHMECDNVIFRASEAYLMLAEAQAQDGKDVDAKATLDLLLKARTKAGQPTLTCANYSGMSGMTALQMVQFQTRVELWLEGGREFYNNKRWGITVDRSSSTNHYWKTGTLSLDQMVLDIPVDERQTNTHWAD